MAKYQNAFGVGGEGQRPAAGPTHVEIRGKLWGLLLFLHLLETGSLLLF